MKHLIVPIAAAILIVLTISSSAAAQELRLRNPDGAAAPAPCLVGDPFGLAQLAVVISSTSPPSTPVVINQHLKVEFVRSGQMTNDDEEYGRGRPQSGPPQPTEPPWPTTAIDVAPWRVFNTRTGFEYRVYMDDFMLRTIHTCHEQSGRTEAGGPADAGVIEGRTLLHLPALRRNARGLFDGRIGPLGADGWSDGSDTRILRTPTTLWPWRAITQSSSWPDGDQSRCTLTLIGPRHLITAAHCLVNFGTNDWKTRKLTPARDGADVAPYGFSQMTTSPPPGVEAWYLVPDPWLDPNTPDDGDKYQWDIGLVLMVDRLGDKTGWMGYGAYPASDLNQRNHLNRGYPGCQSDYAEKPAGCQMARLYGDTNYCAIGYYHNPGSNGWNREFAFSCDISRGHSGSAIYHYRYSPSKGKDVPVVIAVVSWHECFTCTAADDYPNHARRLTPWVLSSISWLKEQFP